MHACRLGLVVPFVLMAQTAFADPPKAVAVAEVKVRPEAAPGPLSNPLKGWCLYTDAGTIHQPYSMVFLYVSWKELEPESGRYEFEKWEKKAWTVPEAAGKHIVLRPYIDYPTLPPGLPDWLNKVKQTPYKEHGGGLSPNYDDLQLLTAMERLIAAMGKRYDGHPRIAFIQLGLLGFWGEWHTYPLEDLYAKPETERRVVQAYHRAFPNKMLMARYAGGPTGKQPWLGYHDDMFPEDTDNGEDWSFLARIRESGRTENWKRAAIGGEMVPFQASKWIGDSFAQTLRMTEKSHFSWVGPYGPALEELKSPKLLKNSETLVRRMGYQYRLTEVRHPAAVNKGDRLGLTIAGENQGVAPFYYPWPVEVALISEPGKAISRFPLKADIRSWQPGPFTVDGQFKVEAPPSRYKVALGIIDPWTKLPAIRFANKLTVHEGWTVLSEIVVETGTKASR